MTIEDERTSAEMHRKVKAICKSLAAGHTPTPEELAERCQACLMTAASMWLLVCGHAGPGNMDDGLIWTMTLAAVEAMEDALDAELALRN